MRLRGSSGRRDTEEFLPEEVKWEFIRWMEEMIRVKARVRLGTDDSDELSDFLKMSGEARTPEEWGVALVDKLVSLVREAESSDLENAFALYQAQVLCQDKVRALVKEHEEELQRLRSGLGHVEAVNRRLREMEAETHQPEQVRARTNENRGYIGIHIEFCVFEAICRR